MTLRLGGNGGIDELRLCANPRTPAYVRADDVEPARICPVSEPWSTSRFETRASPGNAPDPKVAPALARWLSATLPAAYVPPALLEELLGESLTQEAESDALCGNGLAMLRLRPYIARAPAALAFRPAGCNCSSLSGLLVHQRAGGDFAVHQLAELPLGTLPLRQVVLSPGEASSAKLLAARSSYRTEFVTVATNQEALSALRTLRVLPDGLAPVAMSVVGFTASQIRAAHVEWSPHFEGDAAVVSEDGTVQLFAVPSAASARARVHPLQGLQVCPADGAPLGWRGCAFSGHPRTLVCASAAKIWLADARSSAPGSTRVVHLMAGGRPTAECFTALCSAEASGSSFMFGAATGSRILLFDSRRTLTPLLSWEHWLGADDPPRILCCQSAHPWMPPESSDPGCFLVASNLGRREAAAFQFSVGTAAGTSDAIGWASELLRTRIGARAIGSGMKLPSASVHSTADTSDQGHASWNISDPPAAGFALLSPDAGSVGVLCNSYGANGFATVFCAHVTDGSKECFHAATLTAASSAAALAAKSTQHHDKRALLDAAQTSRKLPLHFALLASPHTDFVNAPHSHPDAKPAVDAAQQSLWPVTLLEASHAASMQFHGQTSSLRDSGVMAAATAAEAGKTRKLGKSLNPERRRAAVVPLLSNGRPANQLMLPAPFVSGTVPILVSSHNALLEVARAVDSRAARLLHLHLPTHAPGATADDADQAPYCMDATVTAPGAGAFHCAAFRAAWATFCAWGAELSCDPSCEVFCPAEHAAGSADAQEPRLDLPPPPADADAAAIEELSRRSHVAWAGRTAAPSAVVSGPTAEAGVGSVPAVSEMPAAPLDGSHGFPAAVNGRQPAAKPTKKRVRRDGF